MKAKREFSENMQALHTDVLNTMVEILTLYFPDAPKHRVSDAADELAKESIILARACVYHTTDALMKLISDFSKEL